MTAVDLSAHLTSPIAAQPAAAAPGASATGDGFSFEDLLDIVNPLQHIPIVSTLYRAFTGDQIKIFPKIAGDTLFGGITGFLSSVADTIFEKITGRNVGDTVLAWIDDELTTPATAVASVVPARQTPVVVPSTALDTMVIPGQDALLLALTRKSIDQDLALRAGGAYRRTLLVADTAAAVALH